MDGSFTSYVNETLQKNLPDLPETIRTEILDKFHQYGVSEFDHLKLIEAGDLTSSTIKLIVARKAVAHLKAGVNQGKGQHISRV